MSAFSSVAESNNSGHQSQGERAVLQREPITGDCYETAELEAVEVFLFVIKNMYILRRKLCEWGVKQVTFNLICIMISVEDFNLTWNIS